MSTLSKNGGLFLLSLLILFSCKKERLETGAQLLVYSSSYFNPHEIRPTGSPNLSVDWLNIDNARPYQDMLGIAAGSLIGSTTNGKPDWHSDIQVNNLRLISASVSVISEKTFVNEHLTDSRIIYTYPTSTIEQEKVIAFFDSYNSAESKINYLYTADDLTNLFKEHQYGTLSIDFKFDGYNPQPIKLNYEIAFSYNYSYISKPD